MFLNLSKKQNLSKTMDFIDKHTGCHPGGAVKNQQQNSKLANFLSSPIICIYQSFVIFRYGRQFKIFLATIY